MFGVCPPLERQAPNTQQLSTARRSNSSNDINKLFDHSVSGSSVSIPVTITTALPSVVSISIWVSSSHQPSGRPIGSANLPSTSNPRRVGRPEDLVVVGLDDHPVTVGVEPHLDRLDRFVRAGQEEQLGNVVDQDQTRSIVDRRGRRRAAQQHQPECPPADDPADRRHFMQKTVSGFDAAGSLGACCRS